MCFVLKKPESLVALTFYLTLGVVGAPITDAGDDFARGIDVGSIGVFISDDLTLFVTNGSVHFTKTLIPARL